MICHQNTQLFSFMTPAVGVAFSWQESKRSRINYLKLVEISGNFHINVRNKCWRVSHSVTHKHELWIWFTLSYAMMKALLRLAAVRDTKQTGELRGDTVHFIASSSALVLMMQNGRIYRPLTQTATCLLRLYSSKHIAKKQLVDQADDNSLTALLTKKRPSKVLRHR